ncbi:heavy-metal-associated domain-containing protein [Streptomyces thioluteus]|uniref:Heavy-metal-associated domain-containing protein n=1 Tax=Streptomyces thioluteus TaxID=66431 RepID=A0ABP6J9Z5_STRTU
MSSPNATPDATPDAVTTVFAVSGLHCGHCETAIAKAVTALPAVRAAGASASAGRLTVTTAGEPDEALLARAVDEAGYALTGRI